MGIHFSRYRLSAKGKQVPSGEEDGRKDLLLEGLHPLWIVYILSLANRFQRGWQRKSTDTGLSIFLSVYSILAPKILWKGWQFSVRFGRIWLNRAPPHCFWNIPFGTLLEMRRKEGCRLCYGCSRVGIYFSIQTLEGKQVPSGKEEKSPSFRRGMLPVQKPLSHWRHYLIVLFTSMSCHSNTEKLHIFGLNRCLRSVPMQKEHYWNLWQFM